MHPFVMETMVKGRLRDLEAEVMRGQRVKVSRPSRSTPFLSRFFDGMFKRWKRDRGMNKGVALDVRP
jgi:hypothetical protein